MDAVVKGLQLDRAQDAVSWHECETTQTHKQKHTQIYVYQCAHERPATHTFTQTNMSAQKGGLNITGAAQYHVSVLNESQKCYKSILVVLIRYLYN